MELYRAYNQVVNSEERQHLPESFEDLGLPLMGEREGQWIKDLGLTLMGKGKGMDICRSVTSITKNKE